MRSLLTRVLARAVGLAFDALGGAAKVVTKAVLNLLDRGGRNRMGV